MTSEAVTPRFAVLLFAIAIAIPRAATLLRSPNRAAALLGASFVSVAAVSALASGSLISLYGQYDWHTGWLFVAALFACWVIGATTPASQQRLLVIALLAGCAVNLAVALLQVVADLESAGLGMFEGRAPALFGNPVHFAALAAGALGLTGWKLLHSRRGWIAGVACAAVAVQLSGSRLAIAIAVAGLAGAVVVYRSRRAVLLVAVVVTGLLGGELLMQAFATTGEGGAPTALSRVASAGADPHARIEGWKSAVDAVRARPVIGAGPGRFQAGITPHRTLELAQASPDGNYIDAHNLIFEYAVTTGALGVMLLMAWLGFSLKTSRSGPLLWFALGVLSLHLVQPQNVATTPLAFLALGAATATDVHVSESRRSFLAWSAATGCGVLALVIGGRVLVGDTLLARATSTRSPAVAQQADSWLPPWPQPARRVAQLYEYRGERGGDDAARAGTIAWLRRAAERDPTRAFWWNTLARYEADEGLSTDAQHHFGRALDADPWSVAALVGIARLEHEEGDTDRARAYLERARQVAPTHPQVVEAEKAIS